MIYVGVDPGTRRAGIAHVERTARGTYRCLCAHDLLTERADPASMVDLLADHLGLVSPREAALVFEYPQKYAKHAAAHEDIEGLRTVIRAIERLKPWGSTVRVAPGTWKGQVPKHILHQRIPACLEWHDPLAWAHLGPDGRDAVGIAIWGAATAARAPVPFGTRRDRGAV